MNTHQQPPLQTSAPEPDELAPARGIVNGILLGFAIFVGIAVGFIVGHFIFTR